MCALSLIYRAELLKQMEEHGEQWEEHRRQAQAACYRNNCLLQVLAQSLHQHVWRV